MFSSNVGRVLSSHEERIIRVCVCVCMRVWAHDSYLGSDIGQLSACGAVGGPVGGLSNRENLPRRFRHDFLNQ
jgi:hypothetical protein